MFAINSKSTRLTPCLWFAAIGLGFALDACSGPKAPTNTATVANSGASNGSDAIFASKAEDAANDTSNSTPVGPAPALGSAPTNNNPSIDGGNKAASSESSNNQATTGPTKSGSKSAGDDKANTPSPTAIPPYPKPQLGGCDEGLVACGDYGCCQAGFDPIENPDGTCLCQEQPQPSTSPLPDGLQLPGPSFVDGSCDATNGQTACGTSGCCSAGEVPLPVGDSCLCQAAPVMPTPQPLPTKDPNMPLPTGVSPPFPPFEDGSCQAGQVQCPGNSGCCDANAVPLMVNGVCVCEEMPATPTPTPTPEMTPPADLQPPAPTFEDGTCSATQIQCAGGGGCCDPGTTPVTFNDSCLCQVIANSPAPTDLVLPGDLTPPLAPNPDGSCKTDQVQCGGGGGCCDANSVPMVVDGACYCQPNVAAPTPPPPSP